LPRGGGHASAHGGGRACVSPAKSRRMLALHTHRVTWPVRTSSAMREPLRLRRGIRVGLTHLGRSARPRPTSPPSSWTAGLGGRRPPYLRGDHTTYAKSIGGASAVHIGGDAYFSWVSPPIVGHARRGKRPMRRLGPRRVLSQIFI